MLTSCSQIRLRRLSPVAACFLATALLLVVANSPMEASDSTGLQEIAAKEFTLQVLPILKAKCFGCHGNDAADLRGEFDVRSRHGLLKGGDSGEPSLVPGAPEASLLIRAVEWDGLEMPPKENDRLSEAQIAALRRWISAGAPWPDEAQRKAILEQAWDDPVNEFGMLVKTSGGLSDEWTYRRYQPEDLWAWMPLKPKSTTLAQGQAIDHFIQKRLAEAGFDAAPQADPQTLLRRATFDLLGLPPSPSQTQRFLTEWQRDPDAAWSALIERLLESPHYGERWAQHWLDVARYADTGGYSNDYERSNAWRYRDYVIRSFNNDKPYDRFVMEQLAGDELADAAVRQRVGGDEEKVHRTRLEGNYTEEESEWIIATGFLRMGPWDNAMVEAPEARQIYLDDVVNSVGQTFLSTTMRCLKCHDHKFDPIPTRDYYAMYATFAGTQMAERQVPFLEVENRRGFAEEKAIVEKMLDYAVTEKERLLHKQETAARAWYAARNKPYINAEDRKDLPDDEKPPRHVGLDYVDEGQLKVREQDEWIWTRRLERYQPMAQSVFNGSGKNYAWNSARKLRIAKQATDDWRPKSVILLGGSLQAAGPPVVPGVLSAVGLATESGTTSEPYLLPKALYGRRLGLAKWIADPRNPLSTRSIVNRIWQYHFGHGLARNANNFGAKGEKPTHPELLDWLARDFVEHGWKIKRLHRLIMHSHAYRQAATHPERESLAAVDSDNRLLAYFPPRHLTAEELRDSMLAVSGELNQQVGGIPARPEINMEVALQPRMIQFSLAPAYQPSQRPEQRNRRSIYSYRVRGQADPFMEVFHQPNPNDSCEFRDSAAVTPQVFTLLNSDLMSDRSIAFALSLEQESHDLEEQIEMAFRRALGRNPTADESSQMVAYVEEARAYHRQQEPPATRYPTQITRSLVEEFSGQPFEYVEILPFFENYAPDSKPDDVSANTRALADLCLLLFNSNEFAFVY